MRMLYISITSAQGELGRLKGDMEKKNEWEGYIFQLPLHMEKWGERKPWNRALPYTGMKGNSRQGEFGEMWRSTQSRVWEIKKRSHGTGHCSIQGRWSKRLWILYKRLAGSHGYWDETLNVDGMLISATCHWLTDDVDTKMQRGEHKAVKYPRHLQYSRLIFKMSTVV